MDHAHNLTGKPQDGRRPGAQANDTTLLLAFEIEELAELTPGELRLLRAVLHDAPEDTVAICSATSQRDYRARMGRLLVKRRPASPVEDDQPVEELT